MEIEIARKYLASKHQRAGAFHIDESISQTLMYIMLKDSTLDNIEHGVIIYFAEKRLINILKYNRRFLNACDLVIEWGKSDFFDIMTEETEDSGYDELWDKLSSLPVEIFEFFETSCKMGMNYNKIAEYYGITVSCAYKRMQRNIKKARKILGIPNPLAK